MPPWLLLLAGAFGAGLALLVASSFLRPAPASFAPTPPRPASVGEALVRERTYTVDATHPDRWVFFDFSRGSTVEAPTGTEWDLAFRRFHVVVNGGPGFPGVGGAAELGDVPLAAVTDVPAGPYVPSSGTLEDTPTHPVLEEWYRYHFLTHLLTPRSTTFALRTADGRYAALRFIGYYCPGARAGCVTFRYTYQGNGERRLTP